MSKAFVRESDHEDGDDDGLTPELALPAGARNYLTPAGYARLREELVHLMTVERPEIVQVVSWAASNGDRSENGDYLYGKRRLREIDRRMRFLTRRLDIAEVVDPAEQADCEQVFFGATVTYMDADGAENTIKIVGVDEAEPLKGRISWVSPVARTLNKARVGDTVTLRAPGGDQTLDIVEIRYTEEDPVVGPDSAA